MVSGVVVPVQGVVVTRPQTPVVIIQLFANRPANLMRHEGAAGRRRIPYVTAVSVYMSPLYPERTLGKSRRPRRCESAVKETRQVVLQVTAIGLTLTAQ